MIYTIKFYKSKQFFMVEKGLIEKQDEFDFEELIINKDSIIMTFQEFEPLWTPLEYEVKGIVENQTFIGRFISQKDMLTNYFMLLFETNYEIL